VDDVALCEYIEAADVCVCLRWPTNGETSASWLRCLAHGKPTITTDLVQLAHLPSLDPRTWAPVPDAHAERPVTVSIDILDEDHSLRLAMKRLTMDADLRRDLGARAREYWEAHHTMTHVVDGYRRAIADAASRPAPRVELPAHLVADGSERAAEIASKMGVEIDIVRTPVSGRP
jgi:hypothetical protein